MKIVFSFIPVIDVLKENTNRVVISGEKGIAICETTPNTTTGKLLTLKVINPLQSGFSLDQIIFIDEKKTLGLPVFKDLANKCESAKKDQAALIMERRNNNSALFHIGYHKDAYSGNGPCRLNFLEMGFTLLNSEFVFNIKDEWIDKLISLNAKDSDCEWLELPEGLFPFKIQK